MFQCLIVLVLKLSTSHCIPVKATSTVKLLAILAIILYDELCRILVLYLYKMLLSILHFACVIKLEINQILSNAYFLLDLCISVQAKFTFWGDHYGIKWMFSIILTMGKLMVINSIYQKIR